MKFGVPQLLLPVVKQYSYVLFPCLIPKIRSLDKALLLVSFIGRRKQLVEPVTGDHPSLS